MPSVRADCRRQDRVKGCQRAVKGRPVPGERPLTSGVTETVTETVIENVVAAALGIALLGYLVYALIRPEKF